MSWHRVCDLKDISSGEIKTVRIDDRDITIVGHDGGVVAVPPHCPHLKEPLEVSGMADGTTLICMKHMWQWELPSGRAMGLAECPLLRYRTEIHDGEIHVDLSVPPA